MTSFSATFRDASILDRPYLRDLPIGEVVPFYSDVDSLGSQPVLSTLLVCAVTDSGFATATVDVGDPQHDVSVALRVASPQPNTRVR